MIQSISSFISYFESIRRRTLNYIQVIPADRIDWSLKAGEFTCGDLIRHLAAVETMYVNVVAEGRWKYPGHDKGPYPTLEAATAYLETNHIAAMNILGLVNDAVLYQTRPSLKPDSPSVKAWRWLMAMVEHEVHHRSQLATYLTLMGIEPPQIYGLGVEDVIALATG